MNEKLKIYFRGKAKMITLYGGAAAAVLSAIVYWNQLETPDMPWISDVAAVETVLTENMVNIETAIREDMAVDRLYAEDNRRLILNGDWMRVNAQLQQKRVKLRQDPNNQDLMQEISGMERALRNIDQQIARLEDNG